MAWLATLCMMHVYHGSRFRTQQLGKTLKLNTAAMGLAQAAAGVGACSWHGSDCRAANSAASPGLASALRDAQRPWRCA